MKASCALSLASISLKRRAPAMLASGLIGLGALCGVANAAMAQPRIHTENGIEYMSGGVGSDESAEMKSLSAKWPATLEFAVQDHGKADFAAGVRVKVLDHHGKTVLDDVVAHGPFMMARLSPGTYRVQASLDGKTLTRTLTVSPGNHAKATFVWPQGTA